MSIGKSQWALVMEEVTVPLCSALSRPQPDAVSSLGLPSPSKAGTEIPELGQEVRGEAERGYEEAQGRAGLFLETGATGEEARARVAAWEAPIHGFLSFILKP